MLTSVNYISKNYNNSIWELNEYKGLNFENYIFNILKKQLQKYYPLGLRIKKTANTRDDGLDIYIDSPVPFSIMDVEFGLKGKSAISVVIECKSTSNKKVSLEKISKNILANKELFIDYFVLVTNGTIVPYSHYEAVQELSQCKCDFLLFDQYLLLNYLKKTEYEIPGDTFSFTCEEEPIQIEYQIKKGKIDGRNCFDLFLTVKNYTPKIIDFSLNILSNRNWDVQDNIGLNFIPPYRSKCVKLIVKRMYNDGIEDFKLNVFLNNKSHELLIKNPEVIYDFQPPLTGEQHKKIICEIKGKLYQLSGFENIYLYGEAGIGKTRIIDEIIKDFIDVDYRLFYFLCNTQNKNSFKKYFYKKLKVSDNLSQISWKLLFDTLKNDKFSRFLIVIEDLHNASENFIKELKDFIKNFPLEIPCAIIMSGREDSTVFNENFYSFSTWLKMMKKVKKYEIRKLKEKECKFFIQSIIRDIPPFVLQKILELSNKNPFYIVQFIEYLLEVQLVTLLNRNTVGISNVRTFSSQVYIPQKIEKLIQERKKNLVSLEYGKQYVDFLYLICVYGIVAPKEIVEEYWGTESSDIPEILFKKHYISYDSNGNIKFDHETLFLYFNKELNSDKNLQRICMLIVNEHINLLEYLNDFQKGKVYFYAKNYKEAEKLLYPIIESINSVRNISSVNLLPEYFNYLKEVYELVRRKKQVNILEKIIYSSIYISMHNFDYGTTSRAINNALKIINKYHANNEELKNTILQLQAHTELTAANLAKAEKLFLDLLADERLNPEGFSIQSKFDLFDRVASLYTRYNNKNLAEKYNQLAFEIANQYDEVNLISLSIMMKAKINYYCDTKQSEKYMLKAKQLMKNNKAFRINCHNNLSLLGARLLLNYKEEMDLTSYIKSAKCILREAIDNNYSFTIIRSNLLLASLYYLSNDMGNYVEKYINDGINNSIRYGCEKLMNYFYNLKAINAIKKGMPIEEVISYFNTMLYYLRKQNLLFLGNLDFCYGNIISLTNYAKYIYCHGNEQMLYKFLSQLDYYQNNASCDFDCSKEKECYYTCIKNIDFFKKNIEKIEKKQLILLNEDYYYPLLDPKTGYYIVIH